VITRVRNRPGVAFAAAHQAPVEDQRDLVGSADVEVVADDLLEEDPPGHRFVQHLGQGELGLQDGDVVAVARGPVGRAKRVRQDRQPPAQQRVDLLRSKTVADGLQRRRILDRGEPVIQRLERDAGLGGLALGPLVAVDAQLGVVREIRAELHKERAEIGVEAIEVEVVDQPGRPHDPRIGVTVGVAAFLGAKQAGRIRRSVQIPPGEPTGIKACGSRSASPWRYSGTVSPGRDDTPHYAEVVRPGQELNCRPEHVRRLGGRSLCETIEDVVVLEVDGAVCLS
jgi:hypothetical protein